MCACFKSIIPDCDASDRHNVSEVVCLTEAQVMSSSCDVINPNVHKTQFYLCSIFFSSMLLFKNWTLKSWVMKSILNNSSAF